MTEGVTQALARVVADLASHGVAPPPNWAERLQRTLGPHDLASLTPREPDKLVEAYFEFMGSRLDDLTSIVFSQAVADLFTANAAAMKPAFVRARKSQFMTRIVLNRRLASRYFHEGRRGVDHGCTADGRRWMLERSLRLNLDMVYRDDRASPNTLQTMHSQIATASAHLARTLPPGDKKRDSMLREGLKHSLAAEEHGDRSRDHDGYAIELALRLHESTGTDALSQIGAAVARVRDLDVSTTQGLVGDVEHARAATHLAERRVAQAIPHLVAAIRHYDRATLLPRGTKDADIGYHLAKRGRCFAMLYAFGTNATGSRDTVQLDRALADWLDPRSTPHRGDHEVARLLLARARLASARSDTSAARSDIDKAAELMPRQDGSHTALQFQGQSIGVALEEALDDGAVEEAVAALSASASLSIEVPVPAGSMTKAAMWLRGRMPPNEWHQLIESVLDRIEIDLAHPALTAAARGHVVGHAASLARALYLTDAPGMDGLVRALDLSRAHIGAAQTLSAAALDGASSAAFEYAWQGLDPIDAEDQLGIWLDALMWGVSALRTEQSIRTTSDTRFDVAACAIRVARTAARLVDITEDMTYATTAADGVEMAASISTDSRISAAQAAVDALRSDPTSRAVDVPATARSLASHVAWRTLADADKTTGDAARTLREAAARQLCDLAHEADPSLGGKRREGRRGVTALRDRHGVSQQLVVLKRVDRTAARREFDAITMLQTWLSQTAEPRGWQTPEPLGVVDVDRDDAIFVMRRLPGHTLAHHAMEHLTGRGRSPLPMVERAVQALADFHTAMTEAGAHRRVEDVTASFCRAATQLVGIEPAQVAAQELEPLLACGARLAKKDAHLGNWIWSAAAGGLIVIDVEGVTTRPAIMELATLIDDLPLFGLDADGWTRRVQVAEHYLSLLPADKRAANHALSHRLEAAALNVAVLGLARLQRRAWGASSRGIRFSQLQHHHYQQLVTYLASSAAAAQVRRAATAVSPRDTGGRN